MIIKKNIRQLTNLIHASWFCAVGEMNQSNPLNKYDNDIDISNGDNHYKVYKDEYKDDYKDEDDIYKYLAKKQKQPNSCSW